MTENLKEFTLEEVASHNSEDDLYLVINGYVYDVTSFDHPGGLDPLLRAAGTDATRQFLEHHAHNVMAKYHDQLCVGRLAFAERPTLPEGSSHSVNPHDNEVPVAYSDPGWHRKDWHTPYYLESHRELQKYIRRLVDKHITPYVSEWDKQGRVPAKIFKLLGEKGILAAAVGGSHFPSELLPADVEPPGNVSVDEWDSFHELVLLDEFSRCGSAGFCWGVFGGVTGGLPPIIEFGSKGLVESVGRAVLAGDRVIALAVTEPYCGTDVANILCSAKLSQDGTHFVLNGEKKWVTNGTFADHFTVAVRTGGPGAAGVSLLVVDSNWPGVTVKPIECTGSLSAGLASVRFRNVTVPADRLVGGLDMGFPCIMHNFNHERWMFCVFATRFARLCLSEALAWSLRRHAFGRPLAGHAIIRARIAEMARAVEAAQSNLDELTFQILKMPPKTMSKRLGGPIALAKANASRVFELCAREAAHILGSSSYTKGGPGALVERLSREVRAVTVPAGSEEILSDLAVRFAIRDSKL